MNRSMVAIALYLLAMIAIIVGGDIAFFQHRFWERLGFNVGVVLVFVTCYLRFMRRA